MLFKVTAKNPEGLGRASWIAEKDKGQTKGGYLLCLVDLFMGIITHNSSVAEESLKREYWMTGHLYHITHLLIPLLLPEYVLSSCLTGVIGCVHVCTCMCFCCTRVLELYVSTCVSSVVMYFSSPQCPDPFLATTISCHLSLSQNLRFCLSFSF